MKVNKPPNKKAYTDGRTFLGEVVINGVKANLFVSGDLVIARFSDHPDDFEAQHLKSLTMHSNVFLITAFRLYLDVQAEFMNASGISAETRPMQS